MPYTDKIIGIYIIKNLVNRKIYIGQSKMLKQRIAQHKSDLRNNTHINNYLQNSFNKYKEDNFVFEVLELCNLEELDNKEVYYINKYDSANKCFGYNIELGGCSNKVVSNETKNKLRKINKDLKLQIGEKNNFAKYSNKTISLVKKLLVMAMDFDEITDITKVNRKTIFRIINMEHWVSVTPELNSEISKIKIKPHGNNHKTVIMFDKKMNVIQSFNTAREASLKEDISCSSISSSCNGRTLFASGYVWLFNDEYLEENIYEKKYKIKKSNSYILHKVNEFGDIIETFNSITDVSKKYKINESGISRAKNEEQVYTKGHLFKKEYLFQNII